MKAIIGSSNFGTETNCTRSLIKAMQSKGTHPTKGSHTFKPALDIYGDFPATDEIEVSLAKFQKNPTTKRNHRRNIKVHHTVDTLHNQKNTDIPLTSTLCNSPHDQHHSGRPERPLEDFKSSYLPRTIDTALNNQSPLNKSPKRSLSPQIKQSKALTKSDYKSLTFVTNSKYNRSSILKANKLSSVIIGNHQNKVYHDQLEGIRPGQTIDQLKQEITNIKKKSSEIVQKMDDIGEWMIKKKKKIDEVQENTTRARQDKKELFRDLSTYEANFVTSSNLVNNLWKIDSKIGLTLGKLNRLQGEQHAESVAHSNHSFSFVHQDA